MPRQSKPKPCHGTPSPASAIRALPRQSKPCLGNPSPASAIHADPWARAARRFELPERRPRTLSAAKVHPGNPSPSPATALQALPRQSEPWARAARRFELPERRPRTLSAAKVQFLKTIAFSMEGVWKDSRSLGPKRDAPAIQAQALPRHSKPCLGNPSPRNFHPNRHNKCSSLLDILVSELERLRNLQHLLAQLITSALERAHIFAPSLGLRYHCC